MNDEMKFFIYLIERYAEAHNTTAPKVMAEWDALGLTDFIYDMYEIYHCEAIENAFSDIDKLVKERKMA